VTCLSLTADCTSIETLLKREAQEACLLFRHARLLPLVMRVRYRRSPPLDNCHHSTILLPLPHSGLY
jgi:hypothetical protein